MAEPQVALGSEVVDAVFSQVVHVQTWVANEALGAALIFILFYMVYRIVKLWTFERNRGTWGDVLFDVTLTAGLLAVFFVPSVNLKVDVPGAGQYQEKAPMVVWLPYAVVKTSWTYGDYCARALFGDEGITRMTDVPLIWSDSVKKTIKGLEKSVETIRRTAGQDGTDRMIVAADSGGIFDYVTRFVSSFIHETFNKIVHAAAGFLGGVLGGAAAGGPFGKTPAAALAVAFGILGGLTGQHFKDIFFFLFTAMLVIGFYAMLIALLARSVVYCFTLPVAVVTSVARPQRGKYILADFVARGFGLALYSAALVFVVKMVTIVYSVLDVYVLEKLETMIFRSHGVSWWIVLFLCFILPGVLFLPLFRSVSLVQDMVMEAVGGSGFFRMGYSRLSQAGIGGFARRIPGLGMVM